MSDVRNSAASAFDRMTRLSTPSAVWKAKSGVDCLGWLYDLKFVENDEYQYVDPKTGEKAPGWFALVVRLTHPTTAFRKDASGEDVPIDCEAGTDVLLPLTYRLDAFKAIAQHPTHVAEIGIRPLEKIRLKKGSRDMWDYDPRIGRVELRAKVIADPFAALMAAAEKDVPKLPTPAKHRHMSADEVDAAIADGKL